MKKVLLLGLIFGAISFTSCKKSGSCNCLGSQGVVYEADDPGYSSAKQSCKLNPVCTWEVQ